MINFKKLSARQEPPTDKDELRERVVQMLRMIYDPEIPVNIYDLGLIYQLDIQDSGEVHIRMTLTAPNCPVAESFPEMVQDRVWCVDGVNNVEVELVWDPPWNREHMSQAAQLQLGLL
jgi:FeS assembly SUF system protein